MEQVRQQMEAQMAGMPEAQRRMMEQMMAGRGGMPGMAGIPGMGAPAPPVETEYRLLRSGEAVGSWSADLYEGTENGTKRWDVWAVDFSDVGISTEDFAAFEQLAAMVERMTGPLAESMGDLFDVPGSADGPGYDGVPVRRVSYRDGQATDRYEMTEISRDPIDPSMFELPAGLTRQTMPTLP
jgi:hypothetical protein